MPVCTVRVPTFGNAQRGTRHQLWFKESPFEWSIGFLNLPCQKQNVLDFLSNILLIVLPISGNSVPFSYVLKQKTQESSLILLFAINFMFSLWIAWLHLPICPWSIICYPPTCPHFPALHLSKESSTILIPLSWSLAFTPVSQAISPHSSQTHLFRTYWVSLNLRHHFIYYQKTGNCQLCKYHWL